MFVLLLGVILSRFHTDDDAGVCGCGSCGWERGKGGRPCTPFPEQPGGVRVYLEKENDVPDESQDDGGVAVGDVSRIDADQLDLVERTRR